MTAVIEKVGVVGCGLMGSGIAEVAARAGLDVVVTESSPAAAEAGIAAGGDFVEARRHLRPVVGRGPRSDVAATGVRSQLDALGDCDVVIEAVAEDEAMKIDVFSQLDAAVQARGRSGVQHVEHPDHETGASDQA